MVSTSLFLIALLSTAPVSPPLPVEYLKLRTQAEQKHAQGAYAQARELYVKVSKLALPPAEQRWVEFRLADELWRSAATAHRTDTTEYEQATKVLSDIVAAVQREQDRDRVWAEAQESLGDFAWLRDETRDWSTGWSHYQLALDWWASALAGEEARQRYLRIALVVARPPWRDASFYYGEYGSLPLDVIRNLKQLARNDDERALAHYLSATALQSEGDAEQMPAVIDAYEAALKVGRRSDWYDDALFQYAQLMESQGRVWQDSEGEWRSEPDYERALALYRRLVAEFKPGQSAFRDQATERIRDITSVELGVAVSNIFLPDSEIEYHLSWRNLQKIELTLTRVELVDAVKLQRDQGSGEWVERIDVGRGKRIKAWTRETKTKPYTAGAASERLPEKLAPGAYVLDVSAGKQRGRALILVTQAAVVLKTAGNQALAYVCQALDGSPLRRAQVAVWLQRYRHDHYEWDRKAATTDDDGLAHFTFDANVDGNDMFVAASAQGQQAFSTGYLSRAGGPGDGFKIYVFTDRPAYRPEDEVQFKYVVRQYQGSVYATPANAPIEWEVQDPRGAKLAEGKAKLNTFGSGWGSLKLDATIPLGEYRINFWTGGREHHIGDAVLFRLEEYKLPEFLVSVKTPEENGQPKIYRVGDEVEAEVQVDYYFGGAVANADIEVVVRQENYAPSWRPPRHYAWYYEDIDAAYRRDYGDGGSEIKREQLKTDARGRARIRFETPRGQQADFEYTIEARVTDSSRREVVGSGHVRVSRQAFYVFAQPRHTLFKPQDKVLIDFKALDANDQPRQVRGKVTVWRDWWFESWLDEQGKPVSADALNKLRGQPRPPGWRLKSSGYRHDEIARQEAATNAEGNAEFGFVAAKEGYYRVEWRTVEKGRHPIVAETTVWVASNASAELGYHGGGLEIVVDSDTARVGQKTPVLITTAVPGRWVLFTVEAEDLQSYRLLHLDGTAKLVELDVVDQHVPNVFLGAAMVADAQLFSADKQLVVPPAEHFLDVTVATDRADYQPRDQATLTVTARDNLGKPVQAEIGLGLVDDSIFYIQQDYAGDPRQFYFGTKRSRYVQTQTTFSFGSYVKLLPAPPVAEVLEGTEIGDAFGAGGLGLVGSGAGGGGYAEREDDSRGGRARPSIRLAAAPTKSAALRKEKKGAKDLDDLKEEAAPAEAQAPITADAKPGAGPSGGEGGEPAVTVRSDFRATAFFKPDVVTDRNGRAQVKVKLPDSLTTWRATARAIGTGSQFGIATSSARTRQPLIVRLQAPRFFVVNDTLTVSAVVNNNTAKPIDASVELAAEGVRVDGVLARGTSAPVSGNRASVRVPAQGEARVDWQVAVLAAGDVKLKTVARGGGFADAMEKPYFAYEHGVDRMIARAGKLRGDEAQITLSLPKRRPGSTALSVQVAASQASTMLDALPYLIDYPYGCTEQTMSRFLPAVIVARTLRDLGVKPETVMARLFGGIEQETAGKTHAKGKADLDQLNKMTQAGLQRLYDFQHGDGGWGWWKEGDSDRFMTAYVVWGLVLARAAGTSVRDEVIERSASFLDVNLVNEERNLDRQAWLLHALSVVHAQAKRSAVPEFQAKAFANLFGNRTRLNAYTTALLTIAAVNYGYRDQAKLLVDNLQNGAIIDSKPDTSVVLRGVQQSAAETTATAHWGEESGWWRWSQGAIETTSFVLRALLAVDPKHKLVEPAMNWLVKNRRGAQWSNTRDTAIAVLALTDYLRVTKELGRGAEFELLVNGTSVATRKLTADQALGAPSLFNIDARLLRDGDNVVTIRKRSGQALYFFARADFFSLEEPIPAAGHEVFVRRQYYKWVGKPTLLKGTVYERQPLDDGGFVQSGDRVEVVVTVEAKNDYEYLIFEDLKPAGLEAVEVRSGQPLFTQEIKQATVGQSFGAEQAGQTAPTWLKPVTSASFDQRDYTGRTRYVYQELRDRKVALFVDQLGQGVWEIRYTLRAEVPGQFHALPLMLHAMYVPEIKANGEEVRLRVVDRP